MRHDRKIIAPDDRLQTVHRATYYSEKEYWRIVESVEEAQADADRAERLKKGFCKTCYYLRGPRIAGQALTESNCEFCGEKEMFGSTHTLAICVPCSKKHKVCRECRGDLDFKKRRKL